ncbi:MAG: ribonuclease R, partial [Thermodesulfovibrionales bacterium]|nr:ribonuclease R [Thermodesulfovibrionales bacterium]
MIDKEKIYKFLQKQAHRPLSFKDICDSFNLSAPERRNLKKLLRILTEEGLVIRNRRGLYGAIENFEFITGYFEAHRGGFGFVIHDRTGLPDIFIPSRSTMMAMDNDKVIVRLENRAKRQGSIIRIIERAHKRIAGLLDRNRAGYFISPKDEKIPFDLYVSPKDISDAKEGDMVIADIITYPEGRGLGTAKVVKVLKDPDSPSTEIESLIDELDITNRFPSKVLFEAKSLEKPKRIKSTRKDMRDLKTVTIDGESARDFDDAISIEKNGDGYKLYVHIADVSYFVGWDSNIDIEARKRGTSFYFPDRVIPMLPRELSEDLCSLKPKEDRLAFTVELEFDHSGEVINSEFYESIINSNERMTYTAVKEILLNENSTQQDRYDYLRDDFFIMSELADLLKKRRTLRGSLDFDLPEPDVIIDLKGNLENIIIAERNIAHRIIEEFMICANESVASFIENSQNPSIYRIHEPPERDKLDATLSFLKASGLISEVYKGNNRDFHQFISYISGNPMEDLITKHILKSLKQARYSTENLGHFGLASECYTHFTSPIRRYPDLIVHRILKDLIHKGRITYANEDVMETLLGDIAFSSSRQERKADDAERKVLDAMRAWFMKDKIGEVFEGFVVNVSAYGLKIRLRDFFIEGFLHVSFMSDDYYKYDDNNIKLVGRHKKKTYKIGSPISVILEAVSLKDREIV